MSQDYESALSESWKIYATAFEIIGEEPNEAFKWVFKRAYQLGKQEKDADTVVQGWVARDSSGFISLFSYLPKRSTHTNVGYWGCDDGRDEIDLPKSLFPDLTWKEDPIEVELIIKRKKKTENQ